MVKSAKMKIGTKSEVKHNVLFNLIPDKPLDADKRNEVKFGHELISKTLEQIIDRTITPFSIGLYGGWGSGKTTIVDLLKDDLNANNKVKTIYIDLWKFENDSLRRQIILKTAEELDPSLVKSLKEKIYFSLSENKDKTTFNWKRIVVSVLLFLIKIGVITLLVNIFIKNLLTSLFTVFISKYAIEEITKGFNHFDKSLFLNDVVMTRDRLSEPEEFECEFKNIIKRSSKEKIVFILDNLDRMSSEKAVEVLSTVKTFLEIPKCIFLVPCDEDAIKKHISSVYVANNTRFGSNKYADEFLRKFFNSIIRIPKFENIELDEYTQDLLQQTNLTELKEENSNLLWLLTYSFRNNPREIKQFINNLVSAILLINKRIENGLIADKNILKDNLPFFAKILIIKQKYPKTYKEIENEILNFPTDWKDLEEQKIVKAKRKRAKNKKVCEAIKFIEQTSAITPYSEDVSVFFTYAQSTNETRLPGWGSFLKAAINRDFVATEKIIEEFIKTDNLKKFDTIAQRYVIDNRMSNNVKSFISSCINTLSNIKNVHFPNTAGQIAISLEWQMEVLEDEEIFPINKTIKLLRNQVQKGNNEKLANGYTKILARRKNNIYPSNNAINILQFIFKNQSYFQKNKDDIKRTIFSSYNAPKYFHLFLSIDRNSDLISVDLVRSFLSNINNESIGEELELDAITKSLPKIIFNNNQELFKLASQKIKEIVRVETTHQPAEGRDKIVHLIKLFYKQYVDWVNQFDDEFKKDNIDYLSAQLVTWFAQCQTWKEKVSMFRTALLLLEISSTKDTLNQNLIVPFVTSAPYDEVFSRLRIAEIKLLVSDYRVSLKTNAIQNYDIFKAIFQYLNEEDAEEILEKMLNTNIDNALDSIEKLFKYKLSVKNKEILNQLYELIPNLNQEQKNKIFDISHKLNCGDDVNITNKFYAELMKSKADINVKKYLKNPKLFSPQQTKELLSTLNS